jgi:hypothetical protein
MIFADASGTLRLQERASGKGDLQGASFAGAKGAQGRACGYKNVLVGRAHL